MGLRCHLRTSFFTDQFEGACAVLVLVVMLGGLARISIPVHDKRVTRISPQHKKGRTR